MMRPRCGNASAAMVFALLGAGACAGAPSSGDCTAPFNFDRCNFEVGVEGDPVLRAALLPTGTESVEITLSNPTGYHFNDGLVTRAPLFTVGQPVSTALAAYLGKNGSASGNATRLASSLGLTLGVNAWTVTELKKGRSETIVVDVAAGESLYYLARVKQSDDDFVAVGPMSVFASNGFLQVASAALVGYDPYDANGKVKVGNSSTGASIGNDTATAGALTPCTTTNQLKTRASLFNDDFEQLAFDADWPLSAGYHGEFGGDWYTDGQSARLYNPNWGGAESAAPLPTTSGIVRFVNVCPATGATISLRANILTDFTDPTSDTTLVLYFFDRFHQLIDVTASLPFGGQRADPFAVALLDAKVPADTRRIAVVPMIFLAAADQGSAYYGDLQATYEPAGKRTVILSDDFSSFGSSEYGDNQPTGWSEFGGDWFVMADQEFATLWNSNWGGDTSHLPAVDTGMVKSIAFSPGNRTISARMFAAATFTDPSSFVRLRLVFGTPDGPAVESTRLTGVSYADISIEQEEIPANASTLHVVVNAYLGPAETSSLYVDDLEVALETR